MNSGDLRAKFCRTSSTKFSISFSCCNESLRCCLNIPGKDSIKAFAALTLTASRSRTVEALICIPELKCILAFDSSSLRTQEPCSGITPFLCNSRFSSLSSQVRSPPRRIDGFFDPSLSRFRIARPEAALRSLKMGQNSPKIWNGLSLVQVFTRSARIMHRDVGSINQPLTACRNQGRISAHHPLWKFGSEFSMTGVDPSRT